MLNLLVALALPLFLGAQDKPAYQIFAGDGDDVKYGKMIRELHKADFVFFGELHNNAIAHWLELEVTLDLYAEKGDNLVLGAEMFETDNQILIEEWFDGYITEKKFAEDCRLWKNYPTDYKPLVMFALEKKLPFIATNVPRRYASLVASKGLEILDSLSPEAKEFLPPLPIEFDPEVPCYKNMMAAIGMPPAAPAGQKPAGMPVQTTAMPSHGGQNLMKAQALKDATMAWSIGRNYKPGKQFIHYNGSYHSDNHEGIIWYLKKQFPDAKILVITTVTQEDLDKLGDESKGKADFVIGLELDILDLLDLHGTGCADLGADLLPFQVSDLYPFLCLGDDQNLTGIDIRQ